MLKKDYFMLAITNTQLSTLDFKKMRYLILLWLSFAIALAGCSSTQSLEKPNSSQNNSNKQNQQWSPVKGQLMTRWAKDVDPDNVLPKYPRPQMKRETWKNLNGLWQLSYDGQRSKPPFDTELEEQILVPFAIESALSGIKKRADSLWYRHTFRVPDNWDGQRVLLHFGAVDWKSTVYVNGNKLGIHKGGYDSFSYDISEHLVKDGQNELIVEVFDPSDDGNQPRGKQVKNPRGIWYTPVTGIWQTVWLEPVPEAYVSNVKLTPDVDNKQLKVRVDADHASSETVKIIGYDGKNKIGSTSGKVGEVLALSIPEPKLWSPDHPFLYDLEVQLLNNGVVVDTVDSYFGMRKIEVKKDKNGVAKIFLNNKPSYQLGPLDQGYWPDGLYTAPTDEALRYDLEMTKRLGFNMNRKHVKVEPARWYYWADRLGVLVWQDMVTGSNATPKSRDQFEHELKEMVTQFHNHPSIVNWIVFNEGWGQYDTKRVTKNVEELDSSRLITDASGWQHHKMGDIIDVHRYPGPAALKPASDRAAVVGEFGGVGYVINNHTWGGDGWGYQDIIRKPEAFMDRYKELLLQLHWMSEEYGMSGGVYTQLTDLETELNGMLTYDREIAKAAAQEFASVNKGFTPYIRSKDKFMDEAKVSIHNFTEEESEIRYTTDGSDPDTSSTLYEEPFILQNSSNIRARTFINGKPVGYGNSKTISKVKPKEPAFTHAENLSEGLKYRYYETPSKDAPKYRRHWPLRNEIGGNKQVIKPASTGTNSGFNLSPIEQEKLFALEYEGYIEVPKDGVYTFHIEADDDAKIYIGGEQIFDRLGQSPATTYDAESVVLKKGLHKIELRYFQAYGPKELKVYIEGGGLEKQQIPSGSLFN